MNIRRNPPTKPPYPLTPPVPYASIWSRIFIPSTRLGQWSIGLMVVFIISWVAFSFVFAAGRQEDEPFKKTFLFFVLLGISSISALGAGTTAIYAVFRKYERSFTIFLIMGFGFLVIFFILAELIIGHD